ncbi:PhoH family protein [Denitrobacterium detoxificans]|jgi:phosphate starvation-inducible PhoH-like protein|uniref:PhoH family protein n=1 Tax=Denitrobacterium detoxificans TaxID=79604 RepID=UPI0026EB5D63|nr:PhoH family protein [Denitrobacterium detoxificans]MBE6466084.1 PhoH family protein [Denitrobacterium detoxificans]
MTDMETSVSLTAPDTVDMAKVVGPQDDILRFIEDCYHAHILVRGNSVRISGEQVEVDAVSSLFTDLFQYVREGGVPNRAYVKHAIELLRTGEFAPRALRDDVVLSHRGRSVRPKTAGQKHYVDAIRKNTITFGIGPAGTGKTYLAMAMAVRALRSHEVSRVILSRPVVEAGENLGFLPGTLNEKIDPYIRPLYDALFEMMDPQRAQAYLEDGTIEIVPLAYMRGRTLDNSFIVLDEAQNTTPQQMKMFLTRLGFASKMVVTGDVTQLDLPRGISGLKQVRGILEGISDIAFCELSRTDIVRHSLVSEIVSAYNVWETANAPVQPVQ